MVLKGKIDENSNNDSTNWLLSNYKLYFINIYECSAKKNIQIRKFKLKIRSSHFLEFKI
jgi:hypothetical protein